MLDLVKKSTILFLLVSFLGCQNKQPKEVSDLFLSKSKVVASNEYTIAYNNLIDTFSTRVLNNLLEAESIYKYKIDSLLCFNKTGIRFICCRHLYVNLPDASSDDLQFIYGEKINGQWYFFTGASIVIPRKIASNHDVRKPLSYEELHQIALQEIYAPYLKESGEINEDWFKSHFENTGMCSQCKTREDFQKRILESVAAQWANRDTTQPIKHLNAKQTPL